MSKIKTRSDGYLTGCVTIIVTRTLTKIVTNYLHHDVTGSFYNTVLQSRTTTVEPALDDFDSITYDSRSIARNLNA